MSEAGDPGSRRPWKQATWRSGDLRQVFGQNRTRARQNVVGRSVAGEEAYVFALVVGRDLAGPADHKNREVPGNAGGEFIDERRAAQSGEVQADNHEGESLGEARFIEADESFCSIRRPLD